MSAEPLQAQHCISMMMTEHVASVAFSRVKEGLVSIDIIAVALNPQLAQEWTRKVFIIYPNLLVGLELLEHHVPRTCAIVEKAMDMISIAVSSHALFPSAIWWTKSNQGRTKLKKNRVHIASKAENYSLVSFWKQLVVNAINVVVLMIRETELK